MKHPTLVSDREASNIESSTASIAWINSVVVVVHGDAAFDITKRDLELCQPNPWNVAGRNVEKNWENFLFEEGGFKAKGREHCGDKSSPREQVVEVL